MLGALRKRAYLTVVHYRDPTGANSAGCSFAGQRSIGVLSGSIRERGAAAWEIRVYAGIDPDTGKPRYRSATVHGNRGDAERGLERLVAEVSSAKTVRHRRCRN